MNVNNLMRLIDEHCKATVAEYIKAATPKQDMISRRKAMDMFGRLVINDLLDRGLINRRKMGDGKTSTIYFSISEIRKAVAAQETYNFLNVNQL